MMQLLSDSKKTNGFSRLEFDLLKLSEQPLTGIDWLILCHIAHGFLRINGFE